jgi:hypothetical protein
MKFKVSEDVDAPQSMVWARFTDFSGFEEDVRGRGATVTRVGNWSETAEGVEWRGEVTIRGKARAISSKVTRLVPEELCLIESRIGGMDCAYEMSFVPLSPEVTRVALVLDLSADTMTARLLLQTLKLARGKVLQRLQGMIARQGNAAEAAYRRSRTG